MPLSHSSADLCLSPQEVGQNGIVDVLSEQPSGCESGPVTGAVAV